MLHTQWWLSMSGSVGVTELQLFYIGSYGWGALGLLGQCVCREGPNISCWSPHALSGSRPGSRRVAQCCCEGTDVNGELCAVVMIRSRLLESRLKTDGRSRCSVPLLVRANYYKWTKNCYEGETRQFTKTMWLQYVGQDSGQVNRLRLLSFTESAILHLFLQTFKTHLNTCIHFNVFNITQCRVCGWDLFISLFCVCPVAPAETRSWHKNCITQTTSWSPCSRTCGRGLSLRVSNANDQCELVKESRLCNLRPCEVDITKHIKVMISS